MEIEARGVKMKILPSYISNRGAYFEISKKIGDLIDYRLEKLFKKSDLKFPEKREVIDYMYIKKKGKQKLRPNIVFGSYCVFSNKDPLDILQQDINPEVLDFMAAVESFNISTYAQNVIHDGKRGILETDKVNDRRKAVFCVNSFFSDAIKLVRGYGDNALSVLLSLNDSVLRSFTPEMIMQKDREKYIYNNKAFQESYYDILSKEGVGKFFAGCIKFGYLASKSLENKNNTKNLNGLESIFIDFGIGGEELNALGDFVLPGEEEFTHEKESLDQLIDLRGGTITPPIRMLYQRGNNEERDLLEKIYNNRCNTFDEHKKILKMLFEKGIYQDISIKLKHKSKELRKKVRKMEIPISSRWFIQNILSLLESNKIYYTLQRNYDTILKQIAN